MKEAARLEAEIDGFRDMFREYMEKAYNMLPRLEKPRILDLGCGTGFSTIELARLSGGEIVGIDIDQPALEKAKKRVELEHLTDRVKVMNCSFKEIDFDDGSFDILWSEGSIQFIGFEKGLKEWKRLLKPCGFLVIHAAPYEVTLDVKRIKSLDYELFEQFDLPENIWWDDYYRPLDNFIRDLMDKLPEKGEIPPIMKKKRLEIEKVKKNPRHFKSAFYILRKT
ncbi:MAG: class I SAM-dependent methyltransferase [Candidatus Hodarchaeota archaeon]